MSPQEYLARAVDESAWITLRTIDGRVLMGRPAPHRTDPDLVIIRTGSRGRPPVVHPADVEDVIFE